MRKRRRIRYDRIIILLIIIIVIVLGIVLITKNNNEQESIFMQSFINEDIAILNEYIEKHKLNLNITYEYNDEVAKDKIIDQSIKENTIINENDELNVIVSLGVIDKEKLKEDNINELGRVPIMMYHGIVNKKDEETKYTGGNVDKDGYNRTAESFRKDLEFYYQSGYRMIRAIDYVNGNIDVEYGKSPIVLTFDDGNENNIKVTGLDKNGDIIIDENSAVGILESFKKKYPDYNVTATFFVNGGLFNQKEYNDKILKWLIDNGYDIGNHTKTHVNFSDVTTSKSEEEVGYMYDLLNKKIPGKYVNLVALPFGSPYKKTHANFSHILSASYNDTTYETVSTFRVGWMPDYSPFSTEFDKTFIMRVRAYDNNGIDFDIEASFRILSKNKYISDGNADMIVIKESERNKLITTDKKVITY